MKDFLRRIKFASFFATICIALVAALLAVSVEAQRLAPWTSIETFAVNSPGGITFDGNDIWVVNELDDTVTKLRGSDGKVLGIFPVGFLPGFATFDGDSIWVVNVGGGQRDKATR